MEVQRGCREAVMRVGSKQSEESGRLTFVKDWSGNRRWEREGGR